MNVVQNVVNYNLNAQTNQSLNFSNGEFGDVFSTPNLRSAQFQPRSNGVFNNNEEEKHEDQPYQSFMEPIDPKHQRRKTAQILNGTMVEEGHVEVIDPAKLRRDDDDEEDEEQDEDQVSPRTPNQEEELKQEEERKTPKEQIPQRQRPTLRLNLNEDDDQPLPSSRRTLQEVNPHNKVRANSTVNAQRRNMVISDDRHERAARVFEQNNSTQPTQRFERA